MNPPARSAAVSLWLGGVMVMAVIALQVVPVLAPAIADEAGLPPEFIGAYNAAAWAAALAGTLLAPGWSMRFGAWRISRLAIACCAAGLLAVASGHPLGLALAAVLIGAGQGLEAPPASHLLVAHVPARQRPFWFSVKQAGVQLGALLASLGLPLLAAWAGWRAAVLAAAVIVSIGTMALGRARRDLPDPGDVAATAGASTPRVDAPAALRPGSLQLLRRVPGLWALALAAAAYGSMQVALNGFFVSFAVEARGAPLVQAGAWLAAAQAGGLVGRILWGWFATHRVPAARLLIGLGAVMSLCSLALGWGGSSWPDAWIWPLVVTFGLTASGWNGVFLAEVARRAPAHEIGRATAAVLVVMSVGLVLGPIGFSAVAAASSWSAAFMVWSATAALGMIGLVRSRRADVKGDH